MHITQSSKKINSRTCNFWIHCRVRGLVMIYFVFQLLKIRIRCRCHLLPSSLIDEDDKGGGEDDDEGTRQKQAGEMV